MATCQRSSKRIHVPATDPIDQYKNRTEAEQGGGGVGGQCRQ